MRITRLGVALAAMMTCVTLFPSARTTYGVDWIAETGLFGEDENWASGFVPDNEVARISNGGTAIVDDLMPDLADLFIGQTSFGGRGTVEVQRDGALFASGLVHVGGSSFNAANGFGQLFVDLGGEVITFNMTSGGDSESAIVLGGGGGSGTAVLAVDEQATLQRNLRIIGPNVEFTPFILEFTNEHTLIAEITGEDHSTINVSEGATLNGSSVHVDLSGYQPSFDDSWTLLDATSITGEFGSITATGLPPGAGVFLSYDSGGENGQIVDLSVGTQLALSVDRGTGAVTIQNQATTESVNISGFEIDGIDGATSTSNNFAPDSQLDLGEVFDYTPSEIGEEPPSIEFSYESGGETIPGRVEFTGPHNNVVLLVDPEDGDAALQNQSIFDIDIDGYFVTSLSGSLDSDAWSSLRDGGRSEWTEANPSPKHVAELNVNSSLLLGAGGAPISLGSLFDFDAEGVEQDLAFQFHLADGETIDGVVEYGSFTIEASDPLDCNGDGSVDASDLACIIGAGGAAGLNSLLDATGLIPGDLDGNGSVAFADFLVLSNNFGSTVDSYTDGDIDGDGSVAFSDFLLLSNNFGSTSAAASVPEPAGWALGLCSLGFFAVCRKRRCAKTSFETALPARPGLRYKRLGIGNLGFETCSKSQPRKSKGVANTLVGLTTLIVVLGSLLAPANAQTLSPVKQIYVSDSSDRDMIAEDLDNGPLADDGDIVARERANQAQDERQVRTFVEFDLDSISTDAVMNPGWSATLVIDFVTRLNTVNDMAVVVGRVLGTSDLGNSDGSLGDSWTTEDGSLPLFEWGRSAGESTAPDFTEDLLVVVDNVKTDPLGTRQVDVTSIVADWVTGEQENNGFSFAGDIDAFQGAGLNNARLVVGLPGDFNGDGFVNFADFLILGDNFGGHLDGPVTAGDIDFDGDVDLDDFGEFKAVLAAQAPAQAQAVPEPTGLQLGVWAFLIWGFALRRKTPAG